MHMVIFELRTKASQSDAYFALAAQLRVALDGIDGFMGIERFQSVSDPDKYVSISLWRDLDAIDAWRRHGPHQAAQDRGKAEIFESFTLRVAAVEREIQFADGRRDVTIGEQ